MYSRRDTVYTILSPPLVREIFQSYIGLSTMKKTFFGRFVMSKVSAIENFATLTPIIRGDQILHIRKGENNLNCGSSPSTVYFSRYVIASWNVMLMCERKDKK